jgi:hypothetical protein
VKGRDDFTSLKPLTAVLPVCSVARVLLIISFLRGLAILLLLPSLIALAIGQNLIHPQKRWDGAPGFYPKTSPELAVLALTLPVLAPVLPVHSLAQLLLIISFLRGLAILLLLPSLALAFGQNLIHPQKRWVGAPGYYPKTSPELAVLALALPVQSLAWVLLMVQFLPVSAIPQ